MKICVVSHSYPFFKGDWRSNFIASLAETYSDLGNDVIVFTPFFFGENRKAEMSAKVKVIEYRYVPIKKLHAIGYGISMKGDLRVSTVAMMMAPFLILFGIINLALLTKREKFDFFHCHWAIPNTLIALGARWFAGSGAKILTSFPGSDVTVLRNSGFLGRILAKIISRSDYMSCNSHDLKDELVKSGVGADKIDFVIYGVNSENLFFSEEERATVRSRLKMDQDTILLLMVGRFVRKKGFSTACRALKHIVKNNENVMLAIVGDGELRSEYVAILQEDGTLGYAVFVGEVNTEELVRYYSACDIFLMPSERIPADGLNTVVPEAMACGRPIVASDVGGNELVVFDGINGFLHREGDDDALASSVNKLIEDADLRSRMGKNSLELVKTRFNWRAIANYYIDRYKDKYGETNRS
jgi:glycosyltransferase involved in cell wall biosynthesis